ncbi:MAG: DUF362 domain-containing protein [Desulfobacterales bacterium]|nr:MAG: DUF362 domain-containing protein [Desulfobacterales bacterium]
MHPEAQTAAVSRRHFLARAVKAAGSICAAGALAYWFYDPTGPGPAIEGPTTRGLPVFSIPGSATKMSIVRGADRIKTLQLALQAIGGIEAFIQKGDRVLLKVNAAFASPPLLSATTHPQLVGELARLCFKAGAAMVAVTDNPINDPASCFGLTGIAQAALAAGAKVVLPQKHFFQPTTLPKGKLIRNWPLLQEPFEGINKLIGLAPVKDHHRSGASLIMKNWYGLLGGRRNIFHQDIHNIIKELAMMVQPTLVILDGTTSMMRNGPTGGSLSDLKHTNTLIASTDQVAADAFGATLLEKPLSDLTFIAKAAAQGVGTADFRALQPVMISAE